MSGYKKYDICTEQLLEEIDSMYIILEEDGRPIRYLKYFQDNPYVLKVFLSNS